MQGVSLVGGTLFYFKLDYGAQTKKFLDEEVLEDAVKFSTESFSNENLVDATYDLGEGGQTSLASVKVRFTYKEGENRIYNVNAVTFAAGIVGRYCRLRKQ